MTTPSHRPCMVIERFYFRSYPYGATAKCEINKVEQSTGVLAPVAPTLESYTQDFRASHHINRPWLDPVYGCMGRENKPIVVFVHRTDAQLLTDWASAWSPVIWARHLMASWSSNTLQGTEKDLHPAPDLSVGSKLPRVAKSLSSAKAQASGMYGVGSWGRSQGKIPPDLRCIRYHKDT